ncbi:MAG TPA: LemA family protein [Phycisphaerae bacterium]|nr:LemA family protein [Phycisphaerae bacterium]
MKYGLIALLVGLAILVCGVCGGGCMLYSSYKTTISLDEDVKAKWADVEVDLQRRYELIPNIVETVKGYAKHEKGIIETVAESRTKYFNANGAAAKQEASAGLERALSRLLVLQEKYPDLKANQQFQNLAVSLEGTENRIAEKRRRYNESVRKLNSHIRGPIGSIAASWADVKRADFFEVDEAAKEAPKVDFDS